VKLFNFKYERILNRVKEYATKDGYTEEELEYPYLDKLSHQTKSPKIMRMVKLAYYLGWMRGIKYYDEMLNTKITLE